MKGSELLGFWTLSIVRYSKNYRIQRFANWIYFHHQVQKPIIIMSVIHHRQNPLESMYVKVLLM
jgi:hypothetical protein